MQEAGYSLRVSGRKYGNMQAIMWDKRTNYVYAESDKRGQGEAIVIDLDSTP